jgi:hypothetical protein
MKSAKCMKVRSSTTPSAGRSSPPNGAGLVDSPLCHLAFFIVESRSGAVAEAPFPLPAHRTGRADFRHPALGQGSTDPKGTRPFGLCGSPPSDPEALSGRFVGLHHSPCPCPRRVTSLNSGPFPPPELPGFRGTTSLSATPPGPACPSRASGWRSCTSTEWGFPCCRRPPCVDMLLPIPRWDRWVESLMGRPIPPVSLFANDDGLPRMKGGSAPTLKLSRPAQHSLALRPVDSQHRQAVHLSRRLRRLCYLRRRSDSFRLERPS